MKLLVITESYWPNHDGGALFERRLSHNLSSRGWNVTIWAPGDSATSYLEQDGATRIEREKALRLVFNRRYKVSYWPWWRARTIIRQTKSDVIHIHNFGYMGLAGLWWARHYKIPVVATNHFMPENALLNLRAVGWLYRPLHRFIWWYLVSLHNKSDFVTSPTPTAIKLLVDHGLKTPHVPVTNGVDTTTFNPGIAPEGVVKKYKLPTKNLKLLYLGRVDGEKRIDIIIDAVAKVVKTTPMHLIIAGRGIAETSLRQQIRRLGIEQYVTWTGFVDEQDKPALYNAADCFVISSPAELQSIVTLEAMSSGLPVLSVDVAALRELCHPGKNGYLFEEDDSAGLARHIEKLAGDPQLRKQFGSYSRKLVLRHHTEATSYNSYDEILNQAASHGHPTS